MSFLERCNWVRNRIPYAYWLGYDVVIGVTILGAMTFSRWFALAFIPLGLAVFFDIVETIVKWSWSRERVESAKRRAHHLGPRMPDTNLDAEARKGLVAAMLANPVYCTVCGAHAVLGVLIEQPRCVDHDLEWELQRVNR